MIEVCGFTGAVTTLRGDHKVHARKGRLVAALCKCRVQPYDEKFSTTAWPRP